MKCGDCGNTHPALPGFPNHVLCDYYHLHMSNLADASRCEHFKAKVISNADRIRSMTDEELADMFVDIGECDRRCPAKAGDCIFSDSLCRSAWLDWLKSTADKEETE